MGSRRHRRGRVRSMEVGWRRLGASRDGSRCSVVLGRFATDQPSRACRGCSCLHPADHSLGLAVRAGSRFGEDRAHSEIPLVQLARSEARRYRQRAGIEGCHVAAHRRHAVNEAADRLAAGRRRWTVAEQAAALVTLADRIFWQGIKDEVVP